MADFRNKKIRNLFEPGGALQMACVEDLALTAAVCRTLLRAALERADKLSDLDNVILDPLPAKVTPQDGEAEG